MTGSRGSAYRLLALDMDGTLLDDDKRISRENRLWIARARETGVVVCLATGRGMHSLLPYAEELGLDGPFVAANGGEVWRSRAELLARRPLDRHDVSWLRGLAVRHRLRYWAYASDGVYDAEHWPLAAGRHVWLKFGVWATDGHVREMLREKAKRRGTLEVTNSHPLNLEFNARGVSKAAGLRLVCEAFGIAMDEVVAVGDSLNDVAMIREAGLGVAMGNAQPEVLAAADVVTASNAEDGVARVIREFVLGGARRG